MLIPYWDADSAAACCRLYLWPSFCRPTSKHTNSATTCGPFPLDAESVRPLPGLVTLRACLVHPGLALLDGQANTDKDPLLAEPRHGDATLSKLLFHYLPISRRNSLSDTITHIGITVNYFRGL